ncbi:MAG: hypothetical protein WC713_14235 [Candidatus Methylomirabilota bacterium]
MENDTTTFIGLVCLYGTATLGIASAFIGQTVSIRRGRKIAPVLDKQYGPKINANLASLEAAVKADDREKAKVLLQERRAILDELKTIRNDYLLYASVDVKQSVTKGAGLEVYLKA